MSSIFLVIIGLSTFFVGYKIYSKFLARNIFDIYNKNVEAPSISMEDGTDFYPTKKHILFGHHFTCLLYTSPSPRDRG